MSASTNLSKGHSLQRVRDLGLRPRTVIDVGVATGTNGLYGAFPDVRYVLIEPLEESRPFMRQITQQYPGSIAIHAAAGRAPGEADFVVDPGLSGSSFLLSHKSGELRKVPVVTVDSVVREHGLEGPFVLKLDVQGFEIEVLEGSVETLGRTDLVIAEASLWADLKKQPMPRLIELISWFDQKGFVVYDIAQIIRRKLDDAITEMDLVFCPADSPLRAVKSYKTPEEQAAKVEERRRRFGLA
jgi:FkbM family methyltransferase